MNELKLNDWVMVNEEYAGLVKRMTPDGFWVGVMIVNEHGRIDDWQRSQLRKITATEAAQWAAKAFPASQAKPVTDA